MATIDRWFFAPALVAAPGSGLTAGAFFAFSAFIMKAMPAPLPGRGHRRDAID